jgi:hypothetical protein
MEGRIGEEVHRKAKAITNRCIICRGTLTAKRKDASYCSTDIIPDKPLSLLPIGIRTANEFIKDHHCHNKEVGFGPRYAVVDKSGEIWGAAIVSRPVTRMLNHGGYTAELRRVCTKQDAPVCCCSMLCSACWRAWKAMGGNRMVTYTLQAEFGTSLKTSGWRREAASKGQKVGRSSDTHPRKAKEEGTVTVEPKWRWEVS